MSDLTVYTLGSPNGIKIPVALEEMGVMYDLHTIDITKGEQFSAVFSKINPRHKIPVLADKSKDSEHPQIIGESCAILLYLAEKFNKLISNDPLHRAQTIEWLFYQASTEGTVFGAYGHFSTYAKDKVKDPYPKERYLNESIKVLDYIESELTGKRYLVADEYSIADIAMFPWIIWIRNFYHIDSVIDMSKYPNILNWVDRCCQRPKTKIGLETYNYLDIKNN
ncbi:TPA: glutathione binding-like protein [Photobacterium damselae]